MEVVQNLNPTKMIGKIHTKMDGFQNKISLGHKCWTKNCVKMVYKFNGVKSTKNILTGLYLAAPPLPGPLGTFPVPHL